MSKTLSYHINYACNYWTLSPTEFSNQAKDFMKCLVGQDVFVVKLEKRRRDVVVSSTTFLHQIRLKVDAVQQR